MQAFKKKVPYPIAMQAYSSFIMILILQNLAKITKINMPLSQVGGTIPYLTNNKGPQGPLFALYIIEDFIHSI